MHVEMARNYRDFVRSLIKTTADVPMSSQLAHFMLTQATTIGTGRDDDIWKMIHPRCDEHVITRPWHYWNNDQFRAGQNEEALPEALKEAIDSVDEEWLLLHIYMVGTDWLGPRLYLYEQHMEKARFMVKNNPDLLCFAPLVYNAEIQYEMYPQGDFDGVIKKSEEIRRIAEQYDDIFWIAETYQRKSEAMRNTNPQKALELLAKSKEIYESLGDTLNVGNVNSTKGITLSILGEYDSALDTLFEGMEISSLSMSSKGTRALTKAIWISKIFCDLNQPEQALEWINWAEKEPQRTYRYFLISKARVLTQLNRLEEAAEYIELAQERYHESGDDVFFGFYNHILGLYELATGETKAALHYLGEAFMEFERLNFQPQINSCLLALTSAELLESARSLKPDIETSGIWMSILEEHARGKDYHGIRMQHALLKAEYQTLIEKEEAAHMTLREALTFSDSAGVETIRQQITKMLADLEQREQ